MTRLNSRLRALVRPTTAIAVLATGALCLVPALGAEAATRLTTPLPCWNWDTTVPQTFPVSGTGFPPNVSLLVGIKGDLNETEGTASTDADGNLTGRVDNSTAWTGLPTLATVEALEPSKQQPQPSPQLLATMQVPAVWRSGQVLDPYPSHRPLHPTAHLRTIWGGYPGQAVYVHYYYEPALFSHPRLVRTVSLGTTTGPCGSLEDRFPILGGMRPRAGAWLVVVDRHRRARLRNGPVGSGLSFAVTRWDGRPTRPWPGARRGTWELLNRG